MEHEKEKAVSMEKFLSDWNGEFPEFPLTAADLKKPHSFMGAVLLLFKRLGIDVDNVLMPPAEIERDEHTAYYWDLIPVINVTRAMNYLAYVYSMPQEQSTKPFNFVITQFLQPHAGTSLSILLLFFNIMAFTSNRLNEIIPYEQQLFGKQDEVKALEDEKNKLIEMLNLQAKEKGDRGQRLEKIHHDIKQFEEELKLEKEAHEKEKKELAALIEENRHLEISVEQKKTHRDALLADVAKNRALKVYDADDIKAQVEKANQNVQEAQEKLDALKASLEQKEISLQNLQNIKPNLDAANNYLYEINKLSHALKELEGADVEAEGPDGELDALLAELKDVTGQLTELQAANQEFAVAQAEAEEKRRRERLELEAALEEAQLQEKNRSEEAQKALIQIEEIKQCTVQWDEERRKELLVIQKIKDDFVNELTSYEQALLERMLEAEKDIESKIKSREL